ncbi:MAG: adenylate/guanylate cyclase domain-containing protein [Microcoleaceae cyanobacterium MO_207.B10]|nr:adenylate/guanylate cyclase domain-containing protein [Microcoleaceae cyanobacterium MO_207.B10]
MTNLRNLKKYIDRSWMKSSITYKFSLASGVLLLLIAGVALASFFSMKVVRNKTESVMGTSIKIQRLVFQMNQALDSARRQEREFFREWQTIGLDTAQKKYITSFDREINNVFKIREELQDLLTSEHISEEWYKSHPDLIEYTEKIEEYKDKFKEAVRLVRDLGEDYTGGFALTDQKAELLGEILLLADDSGLISLYNQMLAAEKEYWLKSNPEKKQSLNQKIENLKVAIRESQFLDDEQKDTAFRFLNSYQLQAKESSQNAQNINDISDDFDRQTTIICNKLFNIAAQEVEEASFYIENTSKKMSLFLLLAVFATLGLGLVITNLFKSALEQLQGEQEKSEKLLLNVLPKPIAERLKDRNGIIADSFEEVTVLFADIAGFTQLSTTVSPTILVQLLNEIFSEFDELAAIYNLEKIKTIGDAYMVVGGLPEPNINHAQAIANMALDMQDVIRNFNQKNNSSLNMRIGLNSGPVVAGVIGTKKFIYDLWGDTVNIASRMESHGIIGEIQVTEDTYVLLKDKYLLEERGIIPVKGKGEMSTYLLKGRNLNQDSLTEENQEIMVKII